MDDEAIRLQTDVAVEGREMFNTSFAISENLHFLIQPIEFYSQYGLDTIPFAGCPTVSVDTLARRISLAYNASDTTSTCQNRSLNRNGTISLYYSNSQINNDELILVEYNNYRVKNITLEGSRLITKRAGSIESMLIKDTMGSLMIYDEFGSSTLVNADFNHRITMVQDTITQISTTGTGGGRNLAGRNYSMEITTPKIHHMRCFQSNVFVPTRGEEKWTFERTVSSAVVHSINYGEANECDTNASVRLSSGQAITFSQ